MAKSEDTELRDLVIESLEKNGSLAKIRALLRANVFLAFEDDCESIKHNKYLDDTLKSPEGVLSLNIIHEFLEFLNLKNTLFVYTAETRQGKEYSYGGSKKLASKFVQAHGQNHKEPLLVSLVRKLMKSTQRQFYEQGDVQIRDEQNCTYIVHDDCSNESSNDTSSHTHSQSEQSVEEKNNLHLRLPLDQSDTDTSSDASRDKTSSEYIPNEHIVIQDESDEENKFKMQTTAPTNKVDYNKLFSKSNNASSGLLEHFQIGANNSNSSESTSYLNLKPFSRADEKLLNTTGLPIVNDNRLLSETSPSAATISKPIRVDSVVQDSKSSVSSNIVMPVQIPAYKADFSLLKNIKEIKESNTSPEYSSGDFTSSSNLENKSLEKSPVKSDRTPETKDVVPDSPHNHSQSSQSSVSISDVPDLIELSGSSSPPSKPNFRDQIKPKQTTNKISNNSDDFSDSPIPSLSNLSLDFHSD